MWRDGPAGRIYQSPTLRHGLVLLWHPAAGPVVDARPAQGVSNAVTRQAGSRLVQVEGDEWATRSFNSNGGANNDYVDIADGGGMVNLDVHSWFARARWLDANQDAGFGGSVVGPILSRQANGAYSIMIMSLTGADPDTAGARYITDFNSGAAVAGNTPVRRGRWRNVLASQGVNTTDLFLDGKQDGTVSRAATSISSPGATPISVGAWPGDGQGFSGADVGIVVGWNKALGPAHAEELQEIFNWRRRAFIVVAAAGVETLTAEFGSYALNGQAAALKNHQKIVAAQGSYALNGQNATLARRITMAAAQGSYSLTGQDAAFLLHQRLMAAQGSYALDGQAASLEQVYKLVAVQGSYLLTGQDATLTEVGAGVTTLTADSGSYTLSGQSAILLNHQKLVAAQGSYSLTGQASTGTEIGAQATGGGDIIRIRRRRR